MKFVIYLISNPWYCIELRRSQTTRFLLTIACNLHRGELGGILHNRVQSGGILPNRMQSRGIGDNNFCSMNRQIHRIVLNKTSRYTANCYCKVTIDYDITVTAFLCVLVPRKTLTYNNKQTTMSVTSRLQRSFNVHSESNQWQWKMMNVWHLGLERNSVILHLLKLNVKIKSVIDRIWKERHIDFVWWNRVKKSCRVRRDFFTRLAPIPPDCLRLVSHDTIVPLTWHDWNRVWCNREQSQAKIVSSESAFNRNCFLNIFLFVRLLKLKVWMRH